MKPVVLLFSILSFLTCYSQHNHAPATSKPASAAQYVCPMHPEVRSGKPGNCPKCGMRLEKMQNAKPPVKKASAPVKKPAPKVAKPAAKKPAASYQCPMHPEVTSDKPGNCPKCGMKLTKPAAIPSTQEPSAVKTAGTYAIRRRSKYTPKVVRYNLYVDDTIVNYSGKPAKAIAINGKIPAPTLVFNQGDTAEVHVHNKMNRETSIHWHGVFLPNEMDGVPHLTQKPIAPHSTFVYRFAVRQNGTYWYHSHSALQEQSGMYGALIFKDPEAEPANEIPVVISDWTDMKPMEVQRLLHHGTDWFAIKKGAVQSYSEAIRQGHFGTKLKNEWKRMEAMDVSDVAYDAFLVNGSRQVAYPNIAAGQKVRLRLVNGGASTYFWVHYSGGKMTVVANDGNDVEPVEVDRLIMAASETYDVIVTVPQNMSYEVRVTPEDRSGSASIWIGSGMKMPADPLPKLKYFAGMKMMNSMMKFNGDMQTMGMQMSNQTMDMNVVMYPEMDGENVMSSTTGEHDHHQMHEKAKEESAGITTLNYAMLKSPVETTLPKGPTREFHFELTGNMNRYVWTLNNKTVSETDKILIRKGENVRITMFNNSMMRHPMHLHGHDFRVINGQGKFAPMKNVIDVMPMETDTIEFAATESGDWFFHCHILYHMMSGMGRIFRYENSPPNAALPDEKAANRKLFREEREFHFTIENDFATNGNDGMAMLINTRWQLSSEWRLGYNPMHGYEVETHIGRLFGKNQWLMPFIGFDWRYRRMGMDEQEENLFGQRNTKDVRAAFSAGFEYLLPLLFRFSAEVYTDGNVRLTLRREDIPLTPRLRMSMMAGTDKEYMAGFHYIITRNFAPSVHYDSDMGFGAGFMIRY